MREKQRMRKRRRVIKREKMEEKRIKREADIENKGFGEFKTTEERQRLRKRPNKRGRD